MTQMRLSVGGENRSTRWKPPTCCKSLTTFYHIMLYRAELELTTLLVIDTDCTGSCKSNYHAIMITTVPGSNWWIPRNEQELLIVPEHLSSLPVLVASVLIDLLFSAVFCTSLFILFLLAIRLSAVRFKVMITFVIINFQTFLTTNWYFYKKNK